MREAQVLREVLADLREIGERNAVPEAAAPAAPEQSFAHDVCNGAV